MTKKISELPEATTVGPTDLVPIVQGGVTMRAEAGLLGGTSAAPVVTVSDAAFDILPGDHASAYLRCVAAGAKTATFDAADDFATGTEYHLANRASSGDLTLTAAGGMVLHEPAGGSLVVPPGGTVTVKFVDTDEADVFGLTAGGGS